MVITKITSGLGNQLFQYAAGRHLAQLNQTDLYFYLYYFRQTYDSDTPRVFKLDRFSINYQPLDNSPWRYVSMATRLLPGRSLPPLVATRYEPHFHYDPGLAQARSALIMLDGFWQSERYFQESSALIRQELRFRRTPGPRFNAYRQQLTQTDVPVSLHIRRGDYVNHTEFSQSFGFVGLDYYHTALAYLTVRFPAMHLYIFSDDPDWVQQNLRVDLPHTFVLNEGPDADVDDLQLMSLCHHHIIANSSFSWWGAWLNSRPDKLVIAPKNWFRNKPYDTSDLVPSAWVRL